MSQGCKITEQDGIYFMTFQVVEWVDIFTRQIYRDIIIDSLRFCQKEKGLVVYAYVIMSNHVHIILQSETHQLSKTLKEFKSYTAKQILEAVGYNTESRRTWMRLVFKYAASHHKRNSIHQFWRHDNHPEIIFSNKFLDQKLNYIHQNPVKAGIVAKAEDYIYSSATNYCDEKGLLDVSLVDPI